MFDHCPLTFLVEYQDWHFDPSKFFVQQKRWSVAELDAFACDKGKQYQFAKRVDALAIEQTEQFERWADLGLVDDCWATLNNILQNASQAVVKTASCVERWVPIEA